LKLWWKQELKIQHTLKNNLLNSKHLRTMMMMTRP
jgi:hypothetical protein